VWSGISVPSTNSRFYVVVLDEIYVRSSGHREGGDALAVIEPDCGQIGVKRIILETELSNQRARRLCGRHGYLADTSISMSKELT